MIKQILQVCRVSVNARPLFLLLLFMAYVLPAMSQQNASASLELRTNANEVGLEHKGGAIRLGTFVGKGTSNKNTDAGWLGTISNHPLDLMTNDQFRMRITESGKVGIGTTTPAHELEVTGMIKTTKLAITDDARAGRVLTSDAYGHASWGTAGQYNVLQLQAGAEIAFASGSDQALQVTLCGKLGYGNQQFFTAHLLAFKNSVGQVVVKVASSATSKGDPITVGTIVTNRITIPGNGGNIQLRVKYTDGKWTILNESSTWVNINSFALQYTL